MKINLVIVVVVVIIIVLILLYYLRQRNNRHGEIDVVYSWIDGNHPKVKKALEKWKKIENPMGESGSSNRFETIDELKYSLRSIYKYAPWVRNIYIVTSHHLIPEWFDEEIGFQHGIYFVDDSTLLDKVPTFNSLAKEVVIHKIPGLSEKYLYFNDDFFLGSETHASDFLHKDNRAKMFLEPDKHVSLGETTNHDDYFARGIFRSRQLLLTLHLTNDAKLKYILNDCMKLKQHAPDIHFVSEDKEKWRRIPIEMQNTANGRFRRIDHIYDNSLFDNYWKLARGKAWPGYISHAYCYLDGNLSKENSIYEHIIKERPKTFCLNDGLKDDSLNSRYSKQNAKEFLEDYFDEPAPWEIGSKDCVPKLIHQMWYDKIVEDNTCAPESYVNYKKYTNSWLTNNPEYDYKFWNRSKVHKLWKHPKLKCYELFFFSLDKHIEKCDFARYAVLYLYGGIYVDLDFICHRSIDHLLESTNHVSLSREPDTHLTSTYQYITNGFIISKARSNFWLGFMNYIMANYDKTKNPVDNTGPGILDWFTKEYNRINANFIDARLIIPVDKYGTLHPDVENKIVHPYCSTIWEEGTDWHDDL